MAEIINLNDAAPAPLTDTRNVKWQKGSQTGTDPASGYGIYPVSAYMTDMVGDTGTGGSDGLVPAPPAGSAAANKFLKADGTWSPVAGITAVIGCVIDGGGSVPATGLKAFIQIPFACTITGWTVLADVSGSAVIAVTKGTFSAYPTASSIDASLPPTISSAQKATSTTLTGWTTTVTLGDVIQFTLSSVATVTKITIELQVTRT